ncbi:3-oxo-5-alpha-steroid 4-dehydrogenase-like protein [Lindgomyces ingoldianus]|uniref:3-oxo-5-alpha-steroid 4-dehydrogenase-like protein n=1 Tax=Lindgomyces ingoldianus TaxID=673940 RepID=A0ACB6RC58_9PLEO|nr:3-oxo-5-alpha-steroid 4-dehydrogenase-like protein [Lindgomyces ingoldianus]KAF2476878.1 3-oxo-5-alpha-steroid 4-dehydrogenase-like protein [Lindgomyces ingoldianus]
MANVVARLLDPVALLRTFFLAASALILFIQAVPPLKCRFLAYGSRATHQTSDEPPQSSQKPRTQSVDQFLDDLASFRIPHNYFTHFYILSVLCSLFWGYQLWPLIGLTPWRTVDATVKAVGKVQIVWFLMLLQGTRRLLESYLYTSKSKSQMWIGHYILGLVFYLTVNVAIWIEITNTLRNGRRASDPTFERKLPFLTSAILLAHAGQHVYHSYLYRLRTESVGPTYKLPSHPLFPNLLCPHYTCEVVIYLLLSFLAAPEGRLVNWTLASATVFVAVNLGVTAGATKHWYAERFGAEMVKGRKRMIPWIW